MKTKTKQDTIWDAVVIGAGPAGMMAAGRAAELGANKTGYSVLLLEKNSILGKKLLITGGGRCNLTNTGIAIPTLPAKYKDNAKFLFSAFSQFSVQDTLNFFNQRKLATKEENEGRIFPVSDKAQSVWDVLVRYMKKNGVRIQANARVRGIATDLEKKYIYIQMSNGKKIITRSCVVATGGISHPETGSTGDGFTWLKKIGHTIVDSDFALVPIALKDSWAKKLGGITLKDIKLTIFQNNEKRGSQNGNLLFTHFGVSGPTILNMSKEIGELMQYGEVTIELDIFPGLDHGTLKQKLQALLVGESNRKLKNTLGKLLPSAFTSAVLELGHIDGEIANHSVRREERIRLTRLMKAIPLNVKGLLGANKAVISSGGVALTEVNFKTMQSHLVPNLYIIGDVLNIDRPSGGYSLQLCWTTGFVAGSSLQ